MGTRGWHGNRFHNPPRTDGIHRRLMRSSPRPVHRTNKKTLPLISQKSGGKLWGFLPYLLESVCVGSVSGARRKSHSARATVCGAACHPEVALGGRHCRLRVFPARWPLKKVSGGPLAFSRAVKPAWRHFNVPFASDTGDTTPTQGLMG